MTRLTSIRQISFITASFVVAILLSACTKQENLIAEINLTIDNWHKGAAESNHAGYIGGMDENGIYIGTDATEHWTTSEFSAWSKPYFDQHKGWNLKKLNRNIYQGKYNDIAWFDELLDTGMGLCRGSGVLIKKNGKWKICHYVLSQTIPNSLTLQVKNLKAMEDSLLIQQSNNTKNN